MSTVTVPLVELRDVSCLKENQVLFEGVNFLIHEGDIVVLRGKSGSGKTTLLKCIAHLILYNGTVLYRGSTPKAYGIPSYRARVLYVPQRPSMLSGSPRDFLLAISSVDAHKALAGKNGYPGSLSALQRGMNIAGKWDISDQLWDREWSNLSGGEAQRIALAIAIGLNTAEVILLDEPTSALDSESSSLVERFMISEMQSPGSALKAIVWITHSDEQGSRVGTRFIQISAGGCCEERESIV